MKKRQLLISLSVAPFITVAQCPQIGSDLDDASGELSLGCSVSLSSNKNFMAIAPCYIIVTHKIIPIEVKLKFNCLGILV